MLRLVAAKPTGSQYWSRVHVSCGLPRFFGGSFAKTNSWAVPHEFGFQSKAYPYILVGIYNTGSCWANLGRPSSYGKINLGWCKNMNHKGSMVHEIGHGNLADEACRITQTLFDISS